MSEDRVRRIVREEIAMALVKIVKEADWRYDVTSDDDAYLTSLATLKDVVETVADGMVRDLAGGS
jgi:hypothetical protein